VSCPACGFDPRAERQPLRWNGHSYPSLGWLLPDFYALHPFAEDSFVADWVGVSPHSIYLHRKRVGILAAAVRHPLNPYLHRDEEVNR
jgi:hypothetical protein